MVEAWRAEYEARRAREESTARASLRRACSCLARLGVGEVRLAYDGEDGAGGVYEIAFEPVPSAGVPDGLAGVICEAAYWLLPPGWEVEAGSFGTLAIDVRTGRVRRQHRRRITSTRDSTEEVGI